MQLIFCKDKEVREKNERDLSYFLHTGVIRIADLCLQHSLFLNIPNFEEEQVKFVHARKCDGIINY